MVAVRLAAALCFSVLTWVSSAGAVDAVTSTTIVDGQRLAVMRFSNASDGTGEADVIKVDVSALAPSEGRPCTGVNVLRVWGTTAGMVVNLEWDATTDVLLLTLPTDTLVDLDLRSFGGIPNNSGAGKTGDILLSTVGHTAGDTYSIVLEMSKTY